MPQGRDDPLDLLPGHRIDGCGGDARGHRPVIAIETSIGAEIEIRGVQLSIDIL